MPALGCEAPQGSSDPFLWGRTPAIYRKFSSGGASLLPATAAYSTWFPPSHCPPYGGHSAVHQMFLLFHLWTHGWKACPPGTGLSQVISSGLWIMRSNGYYFWPGTFSNQCETLQPCSRQWLVSAWVPEWAWHWEEPQVNPHWSIRKVETSLAETTKRVGGCLSLQHSLAQPD